MAFKQLVEAENRIGYQIGYHIMPRRGFMDKPQGYTEGKTGGRQEVWKSLEPTHVVRLLAGDPLSITDYVYTEGAVMMEGPVFKTLDDLRYAHPELKIPDNF